LAHPSLPDRRIEVKAARPAGKNGAGRAGDELPADANVLAQAITGDDARQSRIAQARLADADLVALPISVLCRVMRRL
jgi:hypothetical protein